MIGLFFGDTDFPKLILKKLKKTKKKYLILDLSRKNIFKKNSKSFRVNIGRFGSILKLLRENKCNKVIFAGKIDKPNLSKLKLDMTGIYYLPRIIKAYKEIFKTKSLHENLAKLSENLKVNSYVREVIDFINHDKKRPICTPLSK